MIVYWRAAEDLKWLGILEGMCISEERYKGIYYTDKSFFQPIQEYELKDMIEYKDVEFCALNNIERIAFYNQYELDEFLRKI